MRFIRYSRWGQQIGRLTGIESAAHYAEINGEDTLTVKGPWALAYGDRILWNDGQRWREHVVDSSDQEHAGAQNLEFRLTSAMQWDLSLRQIRQFVANNVSAEEVLSIVLAGTIWEVGEIEDMGERDFKFVRESVYQALCDIAGEFLCEFEQVIEVDGSGVAHRRINLAKERGRDNGTRFTYGRSMSGVKKEILNEPVYTAVYGFGKTTGTKTDGVDDRLWCYVKDDELLDYWGIPDGLGGVMHAEGIFDDAQIETAAELRQKTSEYLQAHCLPAVSYETTIPFLCLKGVDLGDTVQVVDTEFYPELRLETRVGAYERDLLSGDSSSVSFGTIVSVYPDVLARSHDAVSAASATAAASVETASSAMTKAEQASAAVINLRTGLRESVQTGAVILTDGANTGTLSFENGGLWWNGVRLDMPSEGGGS